jgi:hypothetical protein
MTPKPPLVEVAPVYFRRPGPEEWSPRTQRGLAAARRLADSLPSLTAVYSVAGWPKGAHEPFNYGMVVPSWQAHQVLAAGLLFQDRGQSEIKYHTWILEDGTLEVLELRQHPDPAGRTAVEAWAAAEARLQ